MPGVMNLTNVLLTFDTIQVIGGGGCVFVYKRTNGVWNTAAPHQLRSTREGGAFGYAVDVFNDCIVVVYGSSTLGQGWFSAMSDLFVPVSFF